MTLRHTFVVGDTTFTVTTRYQPLSGFQRRRLGPGVTVAVGDKHTGENRVIRKFCVVGEQLSEAKRCLREIRFLRHFKGHDNILRLHDIDMNFHSNGDFDEVYLIEEYCETDLQRIVGFVPLLLPHKHKLTECGQIRLESPLSNNEIRAFAHQVLRGVSYIHSAGVVLQDMSPENIVVSEEGAVKIGAFGSLKNTTASNGKAVLNNHLVSPYEAPETQSAAANVWSVGCIIAELITGRPIFSATTFEDHIHQVFQHTGLPSESTSAIADSEVRDLVLSIGSISRIPLEERYKDADPQLLDLLSEMLTFDAQERTTCKHALSHEYLEAVRNYADGFSCFPYKGQLEEGMSSIAEVKASLVKELRSFCALQYDEMMDISLPQLDMGGDFILDPVTVFPKADLILTMTSEHIASNRTFFVANQCYFREGLLDIVSISKAFTSVLRRLPSPRRSDVWKGFSTTRGASVDTPRAPSLSLGMDKIGEDFSQTVQSSLSQANVSVQQPYSRRATSVARFSAFFDGRPENGQAKTSLDIVDLTQQIRKEANYPYTGGAFSDVWRCNWFRDPADPGPELVAVKAMRTNVLSDKVKEKKRFHRELGIWKRLDHKNIIPLYGIASGFGFYPAIVCPWAPKGALTNYLQQYYRTLSILDKLRLLDDISSGLEYLHQNHVTHGDLTGNNVLIFDDGTACLADFGMSTALKELWGSAYFTESARGCFRWAAPELFQGDHERAMSCIGPACDVYSFGSIILQVLSGKVPYFYLNSDTQVLGMVVRGINPIRPKKPIIDDEQWDIIQWCWTRNSTDRPEIQEVANALKSLGQPKPVDANEDSQTAQVA
ncbi:hypothetical protein ID866_4446 [Astraeus odoratus]|nr:hypothetical protein ID866_4446 [Astraeus odoratus]